MKKQSMLAGQSAVFSSFGCDKSRRAFKGLACEVPMQDGDMFVVSPTFASFTWNARKNVDKMDSQWQKYLNRYLRHSRGWMLLFEHVQSFLWAQSALCCSMLQICRTHHRPSREKYCFWSHQVGKNATLNLERVQFYPTMMCVAIWEKQARSLWREFSSFWNDWMFGKYSGPGCPQVKER